MSRSIVMELDKRTAVVLTPDGQFIRVKREVQYEVGGEIADPVPVRAAPRNRQRWLQSGAFVSAMLLIMVGFWAFRAPPVVAYVSMDINPSIELGLDAKERVRELRAVNEDAEAIIEGLKYRGKNLETVMNELARRLVEAHILPLEDGEVVIASVPVRALEEQWENQVTQKITQILNDATKREDPDQIAKLDVTTISLPVEVRDEAEVNGLSSGKMAFWLILESQGHELSLETLKNESLKKIAASWGGVNEVMSNYEQKNDDKDKDKVKDKDKDDKDDKDNKDDKDDKDDKDNKDDKDDKNDKDGKENKDYMKNKDSKEDKELSEDQNDMEDNSSKKNDKNKDIEEKRDDQNKDDEKSTKDDDNDDKDDNEDNKKMDKSETWKQLIDDSKKPEKSQSPEKSRDSSSGDDKRGSDENDGDDLGDDSQDHSDNEREDNKGKQRGSQDDRND